MNRAGRWVLAVVLAQAGFMGAYWLVQQRRASPPDEGLSTAPATPVDLAMPALKLRGPDGARVELSFAGRRTLVHVWATWCPPCRAELPGLLHLPSKYGVPVMAISLDKSWPEVEGFVGVRDLSSMVLGEAAQFERALGVRRLPVTFLVDTDGRIRQRFDGARDWTDEAFVRASLKP